MTSNKIGELSDNPSERKENVNIVLSDKQETCLHEIYHRMPDVAEQFIEQGFHNDAFDVALWEILFERSVDFWTREIVSAYQMVLNNIYISEGYIDGHAVHLFESNRKRGQFEALCISMGSEQLRRDGPYKSRKDHY